MQQLIAQLSATYVERSETIEPLVAYVCRSRSSLSRSVNNAPWSWARERAASVKPARAKIGQQYTTESIPWR